MNSEVITADSKSALAAHKIAGGRVFGWPESLRRPRAIIKTICGIDLNAAVDVKGAGSSRLHLASTDGPLVTAARVGAPLRAEIDFGVGARVQVNGVINERESARGTIVVDVDADRMYAEALAMACMRDGLVSDRKALLAGGLPIPNLASEVDYHELSIREDYESIMQLRMDAYAPAGKAPVGVQDIGVMGDQWDALALHIGAFFSGKLIGALRVIIQPEGAQWEHDRFIQWKQGLPGRAECVEVTRVCIAPLFQKSGVAAELLKRAALATLRAGRRYVVGGATDAMIDVYRALGCQPTGRRFAHTDLCGVEHQVFVGDVRRSLCGVGMDLSTWMIFWADTAKVALETRLLVPVTSADRARLHIGYVLAALTKPVLRIAA